MRTGTMQLVIVKDYCSMHGDVILVGCSNGSRELPIAMFSLDNRPKYTVYVPLNQVTCP